MTALVNEFAGLLYLFVSGYLVFRFGRLLFHYGKSWALAGFATSVILIVSSMAIQRGWAGFTRHLSGDGEFNIFMDDWRWPVNLAAALIFLIGSYLFEHEMMEIKSPNKQKLIYSGLFVAAGVVAFL